MLGEFYGMDLFHAYTLTKTCLCAGMKLCLPIEILNTLPEYKDKAHEQLPTFFHTHKLTDESQLKEIDSIINYLALHVQDLH